MNARQRNYVVKWRADNPEKSKAIWDRWYAKNADYDRERCNRYDAANREKRRAAIAKKRADDPERDREIRQAWRHANPDRMRDNYYRYRATVRDPTPATRNYISVLLADPCSYCGTADATMHVDHIEPRSRGGAHDWTNLTASCSSCNPSKGNKKLLHWIAGS